MEGWTLNFFFYVALNFNPIHLSVKPIQKEIVQETIRKVFYNLILSKDMVMDSFVDSFKNRNCILVTRNKSDKTMDRKSKRKI